MHQHAKFRYNRSIGCEGIKNFRFSHGQICEILIADAVWRSRPITVPNFDKNCRSVTEILHFFLIFKIAAAVILNC